MSSLVGIKAAAASAQLDGKPGVEISVFGRTGFPVRNAMAMMRIGDRLFTLSRYLLHREKPMTHSSATLDDLRLQPHWSYSAVNQFLRICPA